MTDAPPSPASPEHVDAPVIGSIPAASVISEFLRVQSAVGPRSRAARFFGHSPLSPDSRPWYLGALGELDVANRLDLLGAGWTVLHSVPIGTRGSDIDHVVVGPGGVFTINTKFHEGANVWVGSRRLLVNGRKTDHLRNTRYEAQRVGRLIERMLGRTIPVTGVIALVGIRRLTFKSRPEDAVVLRAGELARWLTRRPPVFSPNQLAIVTSALTAPSTWGASPPPPDLGAFMDLRAETQSARRVRLGWALGLLFGGPVALLSVLQVLPALVR